MADERNLGVRITATDSATPAIQALSTELERLGALQKLFATGATSAAQEAVAATIKQTEAIRAQIQVIQAQQDAFRASAIAAREIRLEAALGPSAERQIISAATAAKTLASSLSVAAAADNTFRESQIAAGLATDTATAQLRRQAEVLYALTGVRARGTAVSALAPAQFGAATTARLVRPETSAADLASQRAAIAAVFEEDLALAQALSGTQLAYKEAAESAKVFERADTTAARGVRTGSAEAAAGTRVLSTEIRHFVAAADELQRHQIGAFFSTLGAAARDAGFGVATLLGSVGGLFVVLGGAAILRGAENMGKWAQSAQAAAGATGLSVNQFTRLDGAMQLLGGKQLETDSALRGLARSLAQAQEPASKAAQAFHALGISQDEIVKNRGNVAGAFALVADAWARVSDSANKAAAGQVIFRGGLERIEPLLRRGADGARQLMNEAERLGITLDEKTARTLAKTGEEADKLAFSIRGKAIEAFVAWGPTIQHATELLQSLGGVMGFISQKAADLAAHPIDLFSPSSAGARFIAQQMLLPSAAGAGAISAVTGGAAGAGAGVPGPARIEAGPITGGATLSEQEGLRIAQARQQAEKNITDPQKARIAGETAVVRVLGQELEEAKKIAAAQNATADDRKQVVEIETKLANAQRQLHETSISQNAIAVRKGYEDFAAAEREKIAEAGKDFKAIEAIYNEWEAEARRLYGESSRQFQQVEREKVLAAEAAIREQIRVIRQGAQDVAAAQQTQALMARVAGIQGRAAPGQAADPGASIAAGELAAQQILAEGWKEIYDLEVVAAKAGAAGATDAQDEANREIVRTWNETVQKLIENFDKVSAAAKRSADEAARAYVQFFDKVGGQVETFGKSLIDAFVAPHTETVLQGIQYRTVSLRTEEIRTAFGKLVQGMSTDLFNALTHAISEALATTLVKNIFTNIQLEPGQGLGSLFGKLVGSIFSGQGQQPSASAFGLGSSSQPIQNFNSATTTATSSFKNLNQAVMQATQALQRMSSSGGGVGGAGTGDAGTGSVQQVIQQDDARQAAQSQTETAATIGAIGAMGNLVGAAVGGSAGRIITGIVSVLTTIAELLILLNIKPSFLGFQYAGGGIVPSAAGGMVTGGIGGQLAILHPREMVLPAHISQGIQNMIGSGNSGGSQNFAVSFNVSAVDSAGVDSFFKRNGPALANAFANQIRANNTGIMKNVKGLS